MPRDAAWAGADGRTEDSDAMLVVGHGDARPGRQAASLASVLPRSAAGVVADYVALTKPPIISLLLVTALAGMFLAAAGVPPVSTALALLLGGTLSAAGANAINHGLERDLDRLMKRTRQRPVASGRISPTEAVLFGLFLVGLSFLLLSMTVTMLAALLVLAGGLYYVLVYTMWLKRSTPQNIVIGGAAGAFPALAGWAAVAGNLGLPAFLLFAVVFLWTPPHFWALAILLKGDYAQAGVPMHPVVHGEKRTTRAILLYAIALVAATVVLGLASSALGWLYLGSALPLGGVFLWHAVRLARAPARRLARHTYLYSLLYLGLLALAIAGDSVLSAG